MVGFTYDGLGRVSSESQSFGGFAQPGWKPIGPKGRLSPP